MFLFVFCRQTEEKKSTLKHEEPAESSRMETEDSGVDSEDEASGTELMKPQELKVQPCRLPASSCTRTVSATDVESRLVSVLKEDVDWTSLLVQ
jgi:hypothetical protein